MAGVTERSGRSIGLVVLLGLCAASPAAALESREVPVGDFQRVDYAGAGTVHLSQGSTGRLVVKGAPDILTAVTVENDHGALRIDASAAGADLVIELRVVDLEAFESRGAGHVTGNDLDFDTLLLEGDGAGSFDMQRLEARRLEVRGRGATRFNLTGQVMEHRVDLSGSGTCDATELISARAFARAAGTSRVWLWVDEQLDVEVQGAARVRYTGSPQVNKRVSGVASVVRVPEILI